MERYLIKGTYLTGRHAGETFLLRKGGYFTEDGASEFFDTTYKTRGIAERICKHLREVNDLDYRFERSEEQYRLAQGKKPKGYFIYELESYEPYPVDALDI